MSSSQPTTGAQAAAMKRLPTSTGAGPTTPSASFNLMPTASTPQSHITPGTFVSPGTRGTPKRGMLGQKTFGAAANGSTPIPSFNFSFGSPANASASPGMMNLDAMGLNATPSASGLMLGAFDGGAAMGLSLSNLGMNVGPSMSAAGSTSGRVDDAERRRRLLAVVETIGKKKGRLSRESLKRLGLRHGLVPDEAEPLKLSLAGKAGFVVDVWFEPAQPDVVSKVVLELMTPWGDAAKGAQVLQDDLKPQDGKATVGVSLDRFSDNLSRLATIDRLGEDESPTCFAAISGIHSSLARLYKHERQMSHSNDEHILLRKKSGRPSMHERRRVGLSMDYWAKRTPPTNNERAPKRLKTDHDMETDERPKDYASVADDHDVCSLTIECERLPAGIYPPIRISNGWISERVEKPEDDMADFELMSGLSTAGPTLEWLDPPVSLITSDQQNPEESASTALTVPSIARFVAKLEPPLALPYHIATQLYASVQVNIAQVVFSSTASMADLILPSISTGSSATDMKQLQLTRTINSNGTDDGGKEFQMGFYWSEPELGVRVDSIPFDHPRRLVEALPVLRQYAFIARLLEHTFPLTIMAAAKKPISSTEMRKARMHRYAAKFDQKNMESELDALLSPSRVTSARALDVSIVTTPVPQMTVSMSSKLGLKKITFNILPNADLEIVSQNIVTHSKDEERRQKRLEGLKTALEISEDLGIWAVWVRRRYLDDGE